SDALMKSYFELEKKLGTMVSVPNENSDDVSKEKFNRAIGVPKTPNEYPTNEMFDDESVKQKFYDIGLTSSQVEKIYSIAQEYLQPILSDLFCEKNTSQEYNELEKFFGSREKMYDALNAINSFGEKFLPHDAFDTLCASAQGIQSVYKMMQSMEPNVETEKNTSEILSDNDLRMMMRNPKYWRDHDAEYVRKIENGFKKLYS
ncbi:MAG: capsid assembly protein, partial [Alphaproteobacteria bacterium]